MAYIVTRNIIDTKDNNRFYEEGDFYPRSDFSVSDDRISELLGKGVIAKEGNKPAPAPEVTEAPVEEAEKPIDKLKIAELKEQLDAQGISYDADAKKADLVALLQGNKEG
ncbi:HeH/LEM domain-containing protein [Streptococcus gordonii]|uniref:HeH/LEM domain-containing protein n=1 Tax=Streptococcus gordonii TaxID=1302 RepID=UPI000F68069D|nr:HeH/LEM domain-containing protein [Streptococcus gordonii]RSJ46633.1 HeH/LEM domain protein [Streptococcus gordonii]RSJ49702.1 HeH/LEM domain protein [Streptococcus gordonii]